MQELHHKIAMRGYEALSDEELLAILLDSKELAYALIEECGSLVAISRTPASRLRMVAGLGAKRAENILASAELGRRIASHNGAIEQNIKSSDDIVALMRPRLKDLKHEECWALFLTNSNRVVECSLMSQGGIQATVVDQRIVVKRALELLTPRLVIVHNHPSGCATPSKADFDITAKLKEATALFDIQLLDHIIISATESYSFKSSGKL